MVPEKIVKSGPGRNKFGAMVVYRVNGAKFLEMACAPPGVSLPIG
jgi:hypothetical protein